MSQAARRRYTQEQIDQFVSAHERLHRGEPKGYRAVMRFLQAPGLDFRGRLLVEADFTGANLSGASFMWSNLERTSFYCADLGGVDARGANFTRADLRGCSLRGADLSGATLDDADMREAVLAKMDLEGGFHLLGRSSSVRQEGGDDSRAFAVDFSNCSMKKVKLQKAKLKGANFSGAVLNGADLAGAVLDGANFDGAALLGVDLTQVRIDPKALKNCIRDPSAEAVSRAKDLRERLATARRWIVTRGAEGAPAFLDDEDLRPLADAFENATLAGMSARNTCGIGVSFRNAQLQGSRFDGADLRDADFSGADLRGASFRGTNLWHANFTQADLRPLPLAKGDRPVDLAEAKYATEALSTAVRG
jgi:uncharacterized protein YjbI with pentapeptide repeats